ncbi:SDR family NAD(P)-dependent oxidoreductase [Aliamphritea ceti]|uniref:SDR family NAD(P)-dependent oxidoreductase n=1 Tax=Aliamphritea ceti TaxID=1524258 RepID=UPI0021C2BE44|nr:SDR family oxidoreductase [Aliamphritea ceti]
MITADLQGKSAIITGGASGLGLCAVELFTEMGCTVAICDVNEERINAQVTRLSEMGRHVLPAPADLRDTNAVDNMVKQAAEAMGGIDYLVNVAGHSVTLEIIPPGDLQSQTEQLWQDIMSVNLMSVFRTVKAAEPYLRESKGAVVSTSSMSGFRSGGSSTPYCVAKGGVATLTKELARGLSPDVRVNAIAPMYVDPNDTNFPLKWESVFEDSKDLPIPRPGTGREYAEVMLFLCAGAGYMTGETLHVDGGYNA